MTDLLPVLTRLRRRQLPLLALLVAALGIQQRGLEGQAGAPHTLYFAEGATGFFTTSVDLLNPSPSETANATITFVGSSGPVGAKTITVAPGTSQSISLNTDIGAIGGYATIVESNIELFGERHMSWGEGGYGSSLERGVRHPSTTWYFAEGATGVFDLYYLLLNPGPTAADVTMQLLLEHGPPVVKTVTVPAQSRSTVRLKDFPDPELLNASFGAALTSTVPIVAEEAMYASSPTQFYAAGSASAATATLATTVYFAEGATGFFDEFLLLLNPSATVATATILYHLPDGTTLSKAYPIDPQRRRTVWVNYEAQSDPALATLANTAVATTVTSDVPIAVTRKMYWPGILSGGWGEASDAAGATATTLSAFIGGGLVGGPDQAAMFLLLLNTSADPGHVQVTVTPQTGSPVALTYPIPGNARLTVNLADFGIVDQPFSVAIESLATSPAVPIVVEVSSYTSPGGQFWAAGSASAASVPDTPVGDSAPAVAATTPATGATTVAVDANLTVTFSEPVEAAAGAFTLTCGATPIALTTVTASPATTFELNPDTDLPLATSCTLTIAASAMTDVDTDDPPDTLAADVTVTFTTSTCATITITPTTVPGGTLTLPYGPVTFTQTGGTTPIAWTVTTGTLPAGLLLDATTGLLAGTPTAAGPFTFTVTATDANACTGAVPLTLSVLSGPNQAPSFVAGPAVTVLEDGGAQTFVGWATGITPGPAEEAGQVVNFVVTGNTNAALFTTAPAVSSAGVMTFTPAANATGSATITLVAQDTGGTALGGVDTSAPQSFMITVTGVNDAPSFVKGPDQTSLENAGAQSVAGWATAISPGPPDEAAQTVAFSVTTNTNAALFSAGPAVAPDGTLSYTSAPNAAGTATITLVAQDTGGTANGGVDTSAPQTFTITITGVNTAPSFTVGPDQTVLEDAGAQTVAGWATAISPGPPDEAAQTVSFTVTVTTNAALFTAAPSAAADGTLTYTPAANANGVATLTLVAQDSGGTANGGVDTSAPQNFTITVTAVNDAPGFTKGADQTVLENAGAQTVTGWATAISSGPPDEAAQAVAFVVTDNTNAALFSTAPAVAPNGTLTYTPAPNQSGTATITLVAEDTGGSANGGVDTSAPQTFTITITNINSAPSFTAGASQTVLEDAGAQTVAGWATAISPGPGDESAQTVSFEVTANTNAALFSAGPAVAANGTLTYTPAANANGVATITLVAHDDGGTANGGVDTSAPQSFTISVTAVNDAPSFVAGAPPTSAEDAGAQAIAGWATAISPGPADEAGQTVTFQVTANTNAALFSAAPAVSPTGTLTYTSAPNAFGTATITLVAQDTGGGVNTSAPQMVTITVTAVNDAPLVVNETFELLGNTELRVDMVIGTTPHTSETTPNTNAVEGVLDNDGDPEGDPFAVTAIAGCSDVTAPFDCTLASGAVVHVDANGEFGYTPAPGTAAGSFTYTVTDAPAAGVPISLTGTVTFTFFDMLWYVDPDAQGGGNGTSSAPFNTLGAATLAGTGGTGDQDDADDYIFIYGATAALTSGIELEAGQHLIGEHAGLTIPRSLNGNLSPTTLIPASPGARPVINAGAGNAVAATEALPSEIVGLALSGANAIDLTTDAALTGATSTTISGNEIRATTQEGIDVSLNAGTPAAAVVTLAITNNTWAAASALNAVDIVRAAGAGALRLNVSSNTGILSGSTGIVVNGGAGGAASTIITGFANNTVSGDTVADGISIASATFDANPAAAGNQQVSGGVLAVGASGNPVGIGALTIGTAANPTFGDLTFADLDLVGTSSGLAANGTGSALALSVAAGASTISASNGPAIDVSSATINLPLQSLTSTVTSGGANGVSLNTVAGTFAAPGSITSTSSTGTAFNIAGGNADVTYSGTITWDVGRLVSIAGTTGGNKTFSGAITDNGDGDGGETGVSMTGNAAAATVAFTGGVVVRTTTNAAFTATGGGTVTVIDPAGPASNTLTTTTGTALNVANATIGTGGLVFQSISANGAANGIVLNTTGTTAGLTIAGNGGACTSAGTCTGGAIQSTTGDGIVLTNTRSTSLTRLFVGSTGNHGINATTVNGLSLTSARVENAGNGDNEHGLQLSNVTGTVAIDATTFSGAAENLVNLQNNNTNATLSVSNASAFSYPSGVGGFANSAILIQPGGTAAITASIQGATFTNIISASAQIGANLAGSNGTQSLTFTGNTVSVTLPARAGGVVVSGQESTVTNITINNNSFSGAGGNGVISIDTNDSSRVEGSASGNTITNPPGVGMFIAVDEAATNEIVVSGNTITNAGIDGIQAVNFGGVGVSTMQLSITNNQVNGHSANASLAFVGGISFTGFEDTSCLVLRGNTVTGTPAGPTQCGGAPCVDYYLEEVGGTMTLEEVPNTGSTTASAAYVNSINDAGPVTIFGVIDLTNGAACNVALMAAGGPAPACATSPVAPITETTLRKLAREAARRLDGNAATEPGSPDLVADSLAALDLTMTDLPGGQLGSAKESGVIFDRNAAGWGWFVDPTPHLDEEFEPASTETGEHRARPGGPADGRIDLLTVLMHEIEHLRGQNHATPSPSAHELMAPRLGTGVRRGRPSGRLAEPAPLVTAIALPGPPAVLAPVLSPQRRSQCTAFHARDGDTTGGDRTPDSVRKVSPGRCPEAWSKRRRNGRTVLE